MRQLAPNRRDYAPTLVAAAGERAPMRLLEFFASLARTRGEPMLELLSGSGHPHQTAGHADRRLTSTR